MNCIGLQVLIWTFGSFAMRLHADRAATMPRDPVEWPSMWRAFATVTDWYHDVRWLRAKVPDRLAN